MSAPPRTRRILLIAGAVAALVASVLVVGPPSAELPLDPTGVGPQGLRGLVETLEGLDVEVTVSVEPPSDTATRALLPVDRLAEDTRTAWSEWVEEGGTLVLTDVTSPLSQLQPSGSDRFIGREDREPGCELLEEVGAVRQGAWEGLEVPEEAQSCFPIGDDAGAWLVRQPREQGVLVVLGSAEPLTNGLLDQADNAVLAATLLGPAPGDRVVVVPRDATATEAEDGLLALIPPQVWTALALAVLALLLAVLWQGRRDGPVVRERLPPVLPSAELARSVAGLLQRAGDRRDGAERLRRGTRRDAARALGLPPDTPHDVLSQAVADRTAVAVGDAEVALGTAPVGDDAALVAVAEATTRLRADLRRPPATADPGATADLGATPAASASTTDPPTAGARAPDPDPSTSTDPTRRR